MCYANSVLQVLVYCPPFQRLFVELGKVLSGTAVVGSGSSGSLVNGSGSGSSSASASGSASVPINGLDGKEKDKDGTGMTPLVDATVEFLGEFMDDKKTKSKAKKQVHSKKGSVLVNGNGSASGVRNKGKEKETNGMLLDGIADDDSDADWDACDSFVPTYLYDAMKLKKRFDHMRVCSFFFFSYFFPCYIDIATLLTPICYFFCRVVIKKMLKNSLGSTLRLSRKSFFHYYTPLTHPSRRKPLLLWKRKRKQLLQKMMVGWRLENGIGLLLHAR